MKINVGTVDRIMRIALGVGLIALAVLKVEPVGNWGYLGIIPLLTGIFRFCPAYLPLGLNTCKTK